MAPIKKILVPIDGSDNSYRALDAAILLSEKLDAKLTAIHVMGDPPVLHIYSQKLLTSLLDAYRKEIRLILSKCSEIATKKGLTINTELLQGNPASMILNYCEKGEYDIVVMGSRGMGMFKEMLLGSVSSKIVHYSCCPVMIIR